MDNSPVPSSPRTFTPAFYPTCTGPQQIPRSPMDSMTGEGMSSLQGQPLPEKVFVGGLSEKTSEQDLREIFAPFAEVKTVKIITDKSVTSKNGEPRRYAFIEFNSAGDAKKVLNQFLPDGGDEPPNIELHGRRLNIGSAFKKTPTFGRVFGPVVGTPTMMSDPYGMYAAAHWQQYLNMQQPPKSPGYYPYGAYAAYPSAYMPQSPSSYMYAAPPSPSALSSGMMRNSSYPMSNGGGHLSPTPQHHGVVAPPTSPSAPNLSTNMAYQLATTMLQQMSLHGNPQHQGGQSVLDDSYNSSSNSSSSRNGGSDRSSDRFQYGGPSLTQLPSGHLDRERNGRVMSIPQPIRVSNGPAPASPYLNGPDMNGYLAATPGMRHQYVQN